jgi:CPA2 family monovalent cation:H+ antiporter-2
MELSLLKDIVIIFALSTLVNLIFTRIKVPTVVWLPYDWNHCRPSPNGLVHSEHQIELLAEIGVIPLTVYNRNGIFAQAFAKNKTDCILLVD